MIKELKNTNKRLVHLTDCEKRKREKAALLKTMLADHHFLMGIDPRYFKIFCRFAVQKHFVAGQFLFHECEEAIIFISFTVEELRWKPLLKNMGL